MDAVLGVYLQSLARTIFKRMELVHTWKHIAQTDWLTHSLSNQLSSVKHGTSSETDNILLRKVNLIHGAAVAGGEGSVVKVGGAINSMSDSHHL